MHQAKSDLMCIMLKWINIHHANTDLMVVILKRPDTLHTTSDLMDDMLKGLDLCQAKTIRMCVSSQFGQMHIKLHGK